MYNKTNFFYFRNLLATEFASGSVYVLPTKTQSLSWEGILFVRSGVYKNAICRFVLQLESTFPAQKFPPQIKLVTPIIHPLVSEETLIFDCSSAFPVWTEQDHIYELLKFFKFAIENIEYSCNVQRHCSNPNAVELHNNDRQNFNDITREIVTKSISEIFNSNENSEQIFTFDKTIIDEGLHEQIMENMKSLAADSAENFTFSFDRRG